MMFQVHKILFAFTLLLAFTSCVSGAANSVVTFAVFVGLTSCPLTSADVLIAPGNQCYEVTVLGSTAYVQYQDLGNGSVGFQFACSAGCASGCLATGSIPYAVCSPGPDDLFYAEAFLVNTGTTWSSSNYFTDSACTQVANGMGSTGAIQSGSCWSTGMGANGYVAIASNPSAPSTANIAVTYNCTSGCIGCAGAAFAAASSATCVPVFGVGSSLMYVSLNGGSSSPPPPPPTPPPPPPPGSSAEHVAVSMMSVIATLLIMAAF